ncbi:MAG TPA: NAD-binding protein [Mobilitalea sp.]|nr:NAD-binding protein [Mobilitalea sp.]
MYIIIIGAEETGNILAEALVDDGHKVCIIGGYHDNKDARVRSSRVQYLKTLEVDNEILNEAGIEHADVLYAVATDDKMNKTAAIIAKRYYHIPKVVVKLNNFEKSDIFEELGIQTVFPAKSELELLKGCL